MVETIGVDWLRSIVMRGKGVMQTADFYSKNWGLEPVGKRDDALFFRGTGPEPFIYGLREDSVYGIDFIGFGMASRDRVDALHRRLSEAGVRSLEQPHELTTPGGGYGFSATDPDDRRLVFSADAVQSTPREEMAKPRKISHVVLNTPRLEDVQDFYVNVLGFRVSDFSANQMVFLRCSSLHHSIALNRNSYSSVNHVAFDMSDVDAVMRGIGRMKTLGQAPAWGPGRHGVADNPFAYFVSPSGFVIEFTSDVIDVDEATHKPQVWSRNSPEAMDVWLTAGPPTPAMRAVMAGRPDPGFPAP